MEYVRQGEMVEGAHCDVMARKVIWKGLRIDPITEKKMTLYELDRNCSVEITRAMTLSPEELQLRQDMGVHLLVGDKLRGDKIQLFVDTIKNDLRFEVDEGVTSRHGAHLANSTKRTIGSIKYRLIAHQNLANMIEMSQIKAIKQ